LNTVGASAWQTACPWHKSISATIFMVFSRLRLSFRGGRLLWSARGCRGVCGRLCGLRRSGSRVGWTRRPRRGSGNELSPRGRTTSCRETHSWTCVWTVPSTIVADNETWIFPRRSRWLHSPTPMLAHAASSPFVQERVLAETRTCSCADSNDRLIFRTPVQTLPVDLDRPRLRHGHPLRPPSPLPTAGKEPP